MHFLHHNQPATATATGEFKKKIHNVPKSTIALLNLEMGAQERKIDEALRLTRRQRGN
jgi:hypothetical protein